MTKTVSAFIHAGALCMLTALVGCSVDAEPQQHETENINGFGAATSVRFGVAPQWYEQYAPPSTSPANVDVVVVGDWLVENGFTDAHKQKISQILSYKKTPYLFGYMATSLTKKGLGTSNDCDGNTSAPLCQRGADYIRQHIDSEIVPAYQTAAASIGAAVGGAEALIHIEPDWYQFSQTAQSNALSRGESNLAMNKILGAIRAGCPTCKVVIDFSPWFSPDKTTWAKSAGDFYAGWDRTVVKYVGLTGKPFPYTLDKIDNFTYGEIAKQLGLPLVISDAYTFGGGPIDIDASWLDAGHIGNAASVGVALVILSQHGDVAGYDSFIAQMHGQSGSQPSGSQGSGSSGGAGAACTDIPPDSRYTCEQQAIEWKKCDQDFMANSCDRSCGRCQ